MDQQQGGVLRQETVQLHWMMEKENAVASGQSFPHFHYQKQYKSPLEQSIFHVVPQDAHSLAIAKNKVTIKDKQPDQCRSVVEP